MTEGKSYDVTASAREELGGTTPPDDEPAEDLPTEEGLSNLTLRDAFALIAMTGMEIRGMEAAPLAARCYEIADAMLIQRLA